MVARTGFAGHSIGSLQAKHVGYLPSLSMCAASCPWGHFLLSGCSPDPDGNGTRLRRLGGLLDDDGLALDSPAHLRARKADLGPAGGYLVADDAVAPRGLTWRRYDHDRPALRVERASRAHQG